MIKISPKLGYQQFVNQTISKFSSISEVLLYSMPHVRYRLYHFFMITAKHFNSINIFKINLRRSYSETVASEQLCHYINLKNTAMDVFLMLHNHCEQAGLRRHLNKLASCIVTFVVALGPA